MINVSGPFLDDEQKQARTASGSREAIGIA